MLRVGDLAKSVHFWTTCFGMRVLRTTDRPEQKYSLTFLGYGTEADSTVLELTYNYGVSSYDLGSAFGHIALSVDDAAATCAAVAAAGYKVSRPAGPVLGGTCVWVGSARGARARARVGFGVARACAQSGASAKTRECAVAPENLG